jgi:hypothetical protein
MVQLLNLAQNRLHLTNNTSWGSTYWPFMQSAEVNGLDTLAFRGGQGLFNDGYASSTPHEMIMVVALTNAGINVAIFESNVSQVNVDLVWYNYSGNRLTMIANSAIVHPLSYGNTNKFCVIDAVFNGAASTIYTNNVAGATVSPGTVNQTGILIGGSYHLSSGFAKMALACLITFTNQVLTTTQRSNVFWYCTNRFALAP